MSLPSYVPIADVITDAKVGFACGEEDPNGIFQIRMNNITRAGDLDLTKRRLVPASHKAAHTSRLRTNDVLFNATNSPDLVGKTALFPGLDEVTVFSNHFIRLRTRCDRLLPSYLARWLQFQFQIGVFKSMCRQWVNQATVGRESLLSLSIPLLSICEQQQVAQALDSVEALRAKRREAITLLDDFRQAIFLDMFGDPVSNPKGWPMVRLVELGSLDRGVSKRRPRNAPELLGGKYPLVQTGDVAASQGYITEWKATYSDIGLAQSKLWPSGTLCITIAANIAKTGILKFDACFPDSVVGFSSTLDLVEYVQVWLSFHQENLERLAPESAQKNITLGVLRGLDIPKPDSDLISSFAKRIGAINTLKVALRSHLAELDALFASLQCRAFRGELWVNSPAA